jgi:hypothetical protein
MMACMRGYPGFDKRFGLGWRGDSTYLFGIGKHEEKLEVFAVVVLWGVQH